ncbi:MAG: 23S rRNA (pseudouridine(1915)-N(3))-methyltransferase RlmH [Betaproteobacteria bacterium]|nr:23S rRNA (pseudouridine(1915)-N(3))-methyltransferase RlmH [Betaproteobacteria bacterium]
MKIRIVALGHRMPHWVREVTQEYARRMPHEMPIELIALKPDARSGGRTTEQILEAESQRILSALPTHGAVYALDEQGTLWNTLDLATTLRNALPQGTDLCFVIGSADGLHPRIKQRAEALVSLSRMTLPHGMVRAILVEQLYRAAMMLKGHPYHRE